MNKVLITGLGAFTPLGTDMAGTFAEALAGRGAMRVPAAEIARLLPQVLVAPAAAEPEPFLERKYAGLDRATQFALIAAQEAMAAAGLAAPVADAPRFGVYVGIGFGGAQSLDAQYTRYFNTINDPALARKNPTVMHPLSVPRTMANATAAFVSMRYGLRGASNTYCVACASSAVAAGEAYRAIKQGYLDAAVVIGTEAMLTLGTLMAWNALRVMAQPDAVDPARSCRPFALDRSGFVLGEGAAALILESESRGRGRGAPVLGELCGYGCSSDAQHLTAPSSAEQVRAIAQALAEAQMSPADVHYLNAHGTATEAGDVVETTSIRTAFGAAADRLAVSSTKSVHGHLIGASGALEFALAVQAMYTGSLPPTAYLDQPDPRCDLDFVPRVARHGCDVRAVLSNSFAFGGSNACLLARRYPQ